MSGYVERLNAAGLDVLHTWLISDVVSEPPVHLLTDPDFSVPIEHAFRIDVSRNFDTTYALGKYLNDEVFCDVQDTEALFGDAAMWAWLSLAYMKALVSKRAGKKPAGSPLAVNHYMQLGNQGGTASKLSANCQNFLVDGQNSWCISGRCSKFA